MPAPEYLWADRLAAEILLRVERRTRTSITWLNHHSIQVGLKDGVTYEAFDLVGVDGQFLRHLLQGDVKTRTSADLVMPRVLARAQHLNVFVVGGLPDLVPQLTTYLQTTYPQHSFDVFDGYAGKPPPETTAASDYDIAIIGLGAPMQDQYALSTRSQAGGPTIALTCGGWLDQVVNPSYYPKWAYRLRANWLFRIAAEPRRLLRRYTTGAVGAWKLRRDIRNALSLDSVQRVDQCCQSAP